jgi:hypothetical protein
MEKRSRNRVLIAWEGRRMRKRVCYLVAMLAVLAMAAGHTHVATAGLFQNPLGSAAVGALIGGVAGGGKGAAIGAAVGGGVGLMGKAGAETKKREEAERRHEQERAEWERQRRLEEDRVRRERQQAQSTTQSTDNMLVSETQRSLIRLGYDPGPVGTMNPKTTAAIKAYQSSKGLLDTGRPSHELLRHMIKHGG